jgi:phosphoribosylformylglycinamidine synthase I
VSGLVEVGVPARVGVVTFPGSLDDRDAAKAVRLTGAEPVPLWHGDADLAGVDAVVLPGGFSYGDYLRAGALARFSPVVGAIIDAAQAGLPVLGICNGFQVLCEARLLPGALIRNSGLHFVCRAQRLRADSTASAWSAGYAVGAEIVIPVKHGEGRYVASPETLAELEADGRVVFRYVGGNPNGSAADIAGIRNAEGNVVGLMPHPEHAVEDLTGPSTDGLAMFAAVVNALVTTGVGGLA